MENIIEANIGKLVIEDYSLLYVNVPITDLFMFKLDYVTSEYATYNIMYGYSLDKQNYSMLQSYDDLVISIEALGTSGVEFYLCIEFTRIDRDQPTNTLYVTSEPYFENSLTVDITIDGISIDFTSDVDKYKIITNKELIIRKPKWSLYDNQQRNIDQWLSQVSALSHTYGLTAIYFKTEPIESETIHTFNNHVFRNVVAIKRLKIDVPENEIPQETIGFANEYESPLSGEFRVQINKRDFELAFGIHTLPYEGDYLFLPLYGKLYSVSVSQPPPGNERFMGVIAWWETYLCKYESNESILVDPNLEQEMSNFPEFDMAVNTLPVPPEPIKQKIFEEINNIFKNTVDTGDKISERTIEEKKTATQAYTNKLVDSTAYVSKKETEKLREFYNKRLVIVSINPDSEAFPVSMYDCSCIEKRTLALQYKLTDYTTKNKFSLVCNKSWELSFRFVLLQKISAEFISIQSDTMSVFTILVNRNKLALVDNRNGWSYDLPTIITINEFYEFKVKYLIETKQYIINLQMLGNDNVYSDIAPNIDVTNMIPTLTHIQLFGGTFLQSATKLMIDDKQIVFDYVNPLMEMNNF